MKPIHEIDLNISSESLRYTPHLRGLRFSETHPLLQNPENGYVGARVIELSCLFDFFLDNGWLNPANLDGGVIDLGTGNGVGLVALRQYTLGDLVGVDERSKSPHGGYSGSWKISTKEIIETAIAGFHQKEIYQFLSRWPIGSASLVTTLYANVVGWVGDRYAPDAEQTMKKILDEIGKVLKPGGQFLFTSDQYNIPKPAWATDTNTLKGYGGENGLTLVLPVPRWVISRYGNYLQTIPHYLEPEIIDTNGEKIGLIRDRIVHVVTKR